MDPVCSSDFNFASIVQYRTERENICDAEGTHTMHDDEETDTETITDSDWEQFEPIIKFNNPKQKCFKSITYDEQKNYTYRKIVSKEKEERKLPSSYYKLDKSTTLLLEKLIDVRSLGPYHDVVGKGRSSIVISAGYSNIKHFMSSFCQSFFHAVKIYKLSHDENLNKAIYKRTKREFENMSILRSRCLIHAVPYPVCYHNNILVMCMVGSSNEPAHHLASYPADLCEDIYHKIVAGLKGFYRFQTVHGKLCAENILIWRGNPYYVGWSHSVETHEPAAPKKLIKDCYFVTKFFKSKNVKVMSSEALFKHVSGFKDISPEVLDVLYKKEQQKVKCRGNPNRAREFSAPSGNCRFK
ncbi:serine/threonine-protein kinase RIO3-like [Cydia fagiglandana]|uniref:serine/threonine-protein kinase RIO3-like n=1 Tax=Cydia fagiglandana TaxID=1458189 RepID=UPI002FEE58B7